MSSTNSLYSKQSVGTYTTTSLNNSTILFEHAIPQLFTSELDGTLKKWSLKSLSLIQSFSQAHDTAICSMALTSDDNSLFTSDTSGCLKFWSVKKLTVLKNYGVVHSNSIYSITLTCDDRFLFTSDSSGFLKQWNVKERKLAKDYGKVHEKGILTLTITHDGKYLFTSDLNGVLKQWSVKDRKIFRHHGQLDESGLCTLIPSLDSKCLFISSFSGYFYQWRIRENKIVHQFKNVAQQNSEEGFENVQDVKTRFVDAMAVTCDNKYLYVSDIDGYLNKWSQTKGKCVKYFGNVHLTGISSLVISFCGRFLFTGGNDCIMKQWCVKRDCLVKRFGKGVFENRISGLVVSKSY